MKYTIRDVVASMPKDKASLEPIWGKLFVRPLSYPLTVLAIRIGLTPNMVSIISIISAVIGSVSFATGRFSLMILGIVFFSLFDIFDCVDGNIARTKRISSYMGEFYDAMGGYTMCAFSLFSVGVAAFFSSRTIFIYDSFMLVVLAALGSITDIFSRLIYQKYTANSMIADSKMGKEIVRENDSAVKTLTTTKKISFSTIRWALDKQFGVGNNYTLILLVAFAFRALDLFIILYSMYHIIAYVAVVYMFCRKATAYDVNHRVIK